MQDQQNWKNLSLRQKSHAWAVVLLAGLFFFYEFIQMNLLGSVGGQLQVAFSLSPFEVGLVSAAYFLSDCVLLYPIGSILDRISSRKMILIGMAICIVASFLLSFAGHSAWVILARFLQGAAAAFCLLSILRLATGWFPVEKMGSVTGAVVTLGMIGGAVSQAPLTWLMEHESWRVALRDIGVLGLGLFILIFLFVKDPPQCQSFRPPLLSFKMLSIWNSLKIVAANWHNWKTGLYISTMNLPVFVLAGLFGAQFMSQSYGFTGLQASVMSMMVFVGTIVGSWVLGTLSDVIKRRRLPMLIAAILSFLLFIFILYGPIYSYFGYVFFFFLLGFITAAQIIAYPMTQELNPRLLSGAAFGFISILIIGLPMFLQPLVGALIQWGAGAGAGAQGYSLQNYRHGLFPLVVGFGISILSAFFLPESYGVEVDEI